MAVLDAVEIEELERLVKSLGQFVFFFARRKVLVRANPSAGVGDELAVHIVDRNAEAAGHRPLLAVAQAKELDELRGEPALSEVGVRRIKGKLKAQRLVA